MEQAKDPLKGYRGLARERLAAWNMRVWGDVRIVNDKGSVFEGVILPRSETDDDLHLGLGRCPEPDTNGPVGQTAEHRPAEQF